MKRESRGGFGRGGFPGGGFPRGRRFPGSGFPSGRFPSGGYPGRDGGPGGGRRGGDDGPGERGVPSLQIEGEYWIADAPVLGTKMKNALLPSFIQTVPPGAFLSPLTDKLGKTKGFPVTSKVIVTTTSPRSVTPTTVTITTELRSITDGPLDASLFQVPDDYKKVDGQPLTVSRGTANTRQ